RQEVHLDLDGAVTLAGLAPAALDVEGEAPGLVAAFASLRRPGVQVADLGEDAGVRCRVRARGPADRRLVDLDHLVEVFGTDDASMGAGCGLGAVQLLGERRTQDAVNQRRLA